MLGSLVFPRPSVRQTGRWPPEEDALGWGVSGTDSGPDGDSSGSNRASGELARGVADRRGGPTEMRPDGAGGGGGQRQQGRRPAAAMPRTAYAPVVHCGSIRQAAAVVAMSEAPATDDGDGALFHATAPFSRCWCQPVLLTCHAWKKVPSEVLSAPLVVDSC